MKGDLSARAIVKKKKKGGCILITLGLYLAKSSAFLQD